jgi:hypothetical protein
LGFAPKPSRIAISQTQEHSMSKNSDSTKGGAMAAAGHKTRRAALRALVGASVLAIPTIGSFASALGDPIFAAIERHKAAHDAYQTLSFAMDDVINTREASDAEWDALWNAIDRARKDEDAAFDELLTKVPTTAAGMRAIIAHLVSLDDGRLSHKMKQLLALLLRSQVLAG